MDERMGEQEAAKTPALTPDDVVNDYLIGAYELEKLKNGFVAPVAAGPPCAEHRHLADPEQAK